MIVRKGQLKDLAELQFLFVETIKSVCKTDYNNEHIEVWTYGIKNKERWREIMINQFVFIAQIENKIVDFEVIKEQIVMRQGIELTNFKMTKTLTSQ